MVTIEKNENIKEILTGKHSFETAYIIEDYPYGFTQRTKKAVWIESTAKGDRIVECTLNPKGFWNKPKAATYSAVVVPYITKDTGYISFLSLNEYSEISETNNILEIIGGTGNLNQFQKKRVKNLLGDFTPENVVDKNGNVKQEKQYTVKFTKNRSGEVVELVLRFNTVGGVKVGMIFQALADIKDREKVLNIFDKGIVRVYSATAHLGSVNKADFLSYIK